jgi:hypothetical protein
MKTTIRLFVLISIHSHINICSGQAFINKLEIIDGKVLDDSTKQVIPYVNIFNESKRQGYYADVDGLFTIEAEIGDTLILSAIGYLSQVYFLTDSSTWKNLILTLEPRTYEIGEAKIKSMPSYSKLKQDVINLELPHTKLDSLTNKLSIESKQVVKKAVRDKMVEDVFNREKGTLFLLSKPILSAQQKEKKKLNKVANKAEQQQIVDKKYNRDIVKNLTNLGEDQLTEFMVFCNFSFDFLLNATNYEIAFSVCEKYKEYVETSP